MEEIKVGEYVRTDIGNIFQYEGKTKKIIDEYISVSDNQNIEFLGKIEKHSKNIIDLVECGDYVNGEHIDFITNKKHLLIRDNINFFDKYNSIRTILTKEQFEQNCYKIDPK